MPRTKQGPGDTKNNITQSLHLSTFPLSFPVLGPLSQALILLSLLHQSIYHSIFIYILWDYFSISFFFKINVCLEPHCKLSKDRNWDLYTVVPPLFNLTSHSRSSVVIC